MNKNKIFLIIGIYSLVFLSCTKDKTYVYNVTDTSVSQTASSKKNVKTTTEFVSIAYSALFGTNISNDKLNNLSQAYNGFGDKKLIERLIIKNFLNTSGVKVPSKSTMNADISKFVKDTYKKFYSRDPNDYELWSVKNILTSDTTISPTMVYYSIMTSNEYRYY